MIQIGDDDVIEPEEIPYDLIEERLFLGSDLITAILNELHEPFNNLFDEGLPSRALIVGQKKWASGRLKLVLMFDPDQEDIVENEKVSPLDEIRKMAIDRG